MNLITIMLMFQISLRLNLIVVIVTNIFINYCMNNIIGITCDYHVLFIQLKKAN